MIRIPWRAWYGDEWFEIRTLARCNDVYREWDALIAHLQERHGDQASVAVFPCGAIQLAKESMV